jgi:hypothetical protein
MKGAAVTVIAALLLGAAPKELLTVAVSGGGRITSRPAGINCPSHCTLRVTKGASVKLTASPRTGARFSQWSNACGRSRTCTVKMTAAKRVRAVFVPIPPPPTRTGHYTGTYTDGSTFDFDVQGSTMTNVVFDFNGHCATGNLAGPLTSVTGSFPIGPGGVVAGHVALTYPNATGTADFAGTITTGGSGSGTLTIAVVFVGLNGTCTSAGTWSSQRS